MRTPVPKFNAKLMIKCEEFIWDWLCNICADPESVKFTTENFNEFEIITCDETPDDVVIMTPIIYEERKRKFIFAISHNSFFLLNGSNITVNHFICIGEIDSDDYEKENKNA